MPVCWPFLLTMSDVQGWFSDMVKVKELGCFCPPLVPLVTLPFVEGQGGVGRCAAGDYNNLTPKI